MAELVFTLTYIFVASALTLLIANRFDQPAIPAYILAGILASPFISEGELIDFVQLGIAFLIFIFGVKFDPEKLKKVEYDSLTVNSLQIILVGVLSFSFAAVLGLNHLHSFYFSVAATLSSSLVGLELISKEKNLNVIHGRLAESTHLIQDMIGIAAFVVISSAGLGFTDITIRFGYAAALIMSALFIRRYIFDFIARQAKGSSELLMLTSISSLTIFIAVSEYLGLSMIIGAFAAGIAVAKFPHNLEIIDTMGSLKDFFSAIFFVTLGALISVPSGFTLMITLSILIFTLLIKPALFTLSLIHQGYDSRTAFLTATGIDQVSEFALIIAIQAQILNIIIEPVFQAIILATTISMVTSTYTSVYKHRIFETLDRYSIIESEKQLMPEAEMDKQMKDHMIILGFDTEGEIISDTLEKEGIDHIIIENDPEKVAELREKDKNYVYGNALNTETWKLAGKEDAKLIVSTAPFNEVSRSILTLETDAEKILRAGNLEEAERMIENGALYVIVPQILTAGKLEEHILRIQQDDEYVNELRRKNLLEIRKEVEDYEPEERS